jgi:Xaa-Pro aminopeptidase
MTLKLCSPDDIKQKGKKYFLEKYCNHNFRHLLGLDVHDVGNIYEKLPVNSILTVEPGIYIESEKIGVRIENNVQLTEQGIIDLMVTIPIEAEEIEEIMNN